MNRRKLVELCWQNFHAGNVDGVIDRRPALLKSLSGAALDEELLLARACCAQVHLLLVDRKNAAKSLEPFVSLNASGRPTTHQAEIERLERHATFGAGAVLAQIANMLYRSLTFDEGVRIAERADAVLSSWQSARAPNRLLTLLENRIWWARLLWHHGKRIEAEALLEKTLNRAQASTRIADPGGADLVTAIGLNLWASFDWIRGNVQDARRRIYRALFLLGGIQDQVRFAHSLFVAGRIEATHSTTGFRVAMDLLTKAQERFSSLKPSHPFLARAMIQQAQCQIKAGLIEDAEKTLERVKKLEVRDEVEQTVTDADYLLSRAWILEWRARSDTTLWSECLAVTRDLHQLEDKSERLALEGKLHYARSLVQQASQSDLAEGQKLLRQVRAQAQKRGRRKIEIAAVLALAESYVVKGEVHGSGSTSSGPSADLKTAVSFWEEGVGQLGNLESTFLREWAERIGESLERAADIKISADLTLHEAKEALQREYVRFHERRGRTRKEMATAMGVAESTVFHLLKKYGHRST